MFAHAFMPNDIDSFWLALVFSYDIEVLGLKSRVLW